MEIIDIGVKPRDERGKGPARRVRRTGRIPAVVYRAGNEPVQLSVDPTELELKMRKSGNRNALLRVQVEGSERLCLLKDIQRHPLSRKLLPVDLYEVRKDAAVEVGVKVTLVGRATGTRKGGLISLVRPRLMIRCLPEAIPATIDLDVTNLDLGDHIRVSEIVPPAGTRILYDQDFNVVVLSGVVTEESEGTAVAARAVAAVDKK